MIHWDMSLVNFGLYKFTSSVYIVELLLKFRS